MVSGPNSPFFFSNASLSLSFSQAFVPTYPAGRSSTADREGRLHHRALQSSVSMGIAGRASPPWSAAGGRSPWRATGRPPISTAGCRGPVSMARRREAAHLHRLLLGHVFMARRRGYAHLHRALQGGPRPHRAAGPLCHGSLKFFW
jgi:hypothetical protein